MGQRPANVPFSDNVNNYKSAEPAGWGDAHYIERGKDITYTIHFQNDGLDTALNVRIIDTISTFLDINTLRQEGASHPYNMSIQNGNVVRFSFPNIHLPNSATNQSAAKGFVSFTISQKLNLPLMTRIPNKASVHFDFRPVITTNTVYHTIGENFTGTQHVLIPGLNISLFPNPVSTHATIEVQGIPFHSGKFQVFDISGKKLHTQAFQHGVFRFSPPNRSSGQYFYQISLDGQLAATGGFVIK